MTAPTRVRVLLAAFTGLLLVALTACSGTGTPEEQRLTPTPARSTGLNQGLEYWAQGSTHLRLDACLPAAASSASASPSPSAAALPAMVIVHGGGFTEGDRSSGGTRTICELLAANGVAAFAIDYRLVPQFRYPSQVEDVQHALEWLRQPAQVARFGIDPARIGLFGSSAGAIISQTVATEGSGALTGGLRVKAVVSLSGVSDMTVRGTTLGKPGADVQKLVLDYLGCKTVAKSCAQAKAASAIDAVDRTDPPMLLVNGSNEIVPKAQATAMRDALSKAGVPVSLIVVPGSGHGYTLLTGSVRTAIRQFLADRL